MKKKKEIALRDGRRSKLRRKILESSSKSSSTLRKSKNFSDKNRNIVASTIKTMPWLKCISYLCPLGHIYTVCFAHKQALLIEWHITEKITQNHRRFVPLKRVPEEYIYIHSTQIHLYVQSCSPFLCYLKYVIYNYISDRVRAVVWSDDQSKRGKAKQCETKKKKFGWMSEWARTRMHLPFTCTIIFSRSYKA